MDEAWLVEMAVDDQPREKRKAYREAVDDLRGQLGDHIRVASGRLGIFLYAATAGAAREAERVAQQVLVQHDITADSRLKHWDPVDEEWQPAAPGLSGASEPPGTAAEPADDDEERTVHEELQERERQRSAATGRAAWQVRVDLASHHDVIALAERLASGGWPVVRRRKYLVAGADCEDDADRLAQEIQGYVGADAVVRVEQTVFNWMPNSVDTPPALGGI
jgi:hypothetical protein